MYRSAKSAARITPLLKAEAGEQPLLKAILGDAELLTRRSRWVIGDDDWARDLADSGVHHALATGENVNVLIIDTQPYSRPSENKYDGYG
jgi:pyruvate/2-oxoacid:ferredoxin oxidoreductase beta subunit